MPLKQIYYFNLLVKFQEITSNNSCVFMACSSGHFRNQNWQLLEMYSILAGGKQLPTLEWYDLLPWNIM